MHQTTYVRNSVKIDTCVWSLLHSHLYLIYSHSQTHFVFAILKKQELCHHSKRFHPVRRLHTTKINYNSRLFPELLTESKCSSAPTIPSFKLQPLPEPRAEHSPYVNSAVPITSNRYKVVRFGARRVPREGGKSRDR